MTPIGGRRPRAPIRPPGPIETAFAAARADNRAALVAFVTAGDPDLRTTARLLPALGELGVDVVELGVPFSDPIADGPVIQLASERALRQGTTLRKILETAARVRKSSPPIVLFSYLNPIHRYGYERFVREAGESGIDGLLVTDLPSDEPDDLHEVLGSSSIRWIPLLAPTSGPERFEVARRFGGGFVYLVSRTGVTGARATLQAGLNATIRRARREVAPLPLAVGFGISTAAQVAAVARLADGVVVGSALVSAIADAGAGCDPVAAATRFLAPLRRATRRSR
jgi:tryptophan synthase alpha chain